MGKPANLPQQLDHMLRQAVALQQNGALAEAEELYREILELKPRHFDALQLLGSLALQAGRVQEGIEFLKKALAINAKQAPLHSNLAYALNALQRFDEALASADRALALQSGFPDALNNRGNAQAGLNLPLEALNSFDRALASAPDFAPAWNNRACVLRDLGRAADALASCDHALALQPGYPDAWSNRGNALSDLNRPHEARESYQRALELAPAFADAWNNLGLTQVDLNEHAQALHSYERALTVNPAAAETHWNRSLCLLQLGQLEAGWAEYEWRWERSRIKASRRTFAQPLWLGDFSINGKTILLHAEQGLGDTLQFCRYAKTVSKLGAKVVLEVPRELMRLMSTLDGVNQLIEAGHALPPFDCHCPLLSLPLACKTDLASIPSKTPYLFADPQASREWHERIAAPAQKCLNVGLVWAGGNRPHVAELRKNDARRSITFERLAPILDVPNVRFFSLQKGPAARQLQHDDSHLDVIDYTEELDDFADTAALVANLDLVISVDTSTAHLAGALDKPVWILNRFDTCWRWMLERTDTPWYAQAKLFRQPALGDWDSVIRNVRDALVELSAS
ncbi:tetratricopeptide repeat protein [Paraburkholderia fungorum]|jgi:tetratricopeptide (TPR) repeat protein|uniref:Tetratricopeptide repeat-containing glycosyltransferase family protein n=1 Tax=Paraburkholderia fungorum TaxID=134537 RepID=A0AAP5QCA0_9BURK|nr:tetratricopeptide repeat protein [Paraburkholderia fungorum]MBU7442129.1 tetratricopeptide repeat-containing glycosyltransferase family protein [Paraburkholderia fungorum]MDT8839599.1 tetratricopeptide repeat-containing glycosyltransferase family protein [Paraburkholderia fungorum]PRZ52756.1 tetratricopeptide repeat protein [Paraburkholderia fungorum]